MLSKRIKILHVGKYYFHYAGGIETHIRSLVEAMPCVDSSILVANTENKTLRETIGDIPVVRVAKALTISRAPLCPSMPLEIAAQQADIIHLHLPNPGGVMAWLASRHSAKLVLADHGAVLGKPLLKAAFQPILNRALDRASAIIATSPEFVEHSPDLSVRRHKCRIIPLGIKVEKFQSFDPSAVSLIKRRHGQTIFLAIGRLVPFKGFDVLVRAMQSVRGTLILIGDGPERENLARIAQETGVANQINFVGALGTDDIIPYLHAADILVFPSILASESFGIVQLEAMAAGLPVINTNLKSGVPFVSIHGITGLTVPPGEVKALSRAMQLLENNPNLRADLGAAALVRVKSEFSLERMAERTLRLYEDVLGITAQRRIPAVKAKHSYSLSEAVG